MMDELRQYLLQMGVEGVGMELTMGSRCVVRSSKEKTKVGGGRVLAQSREALVAV